MRSTGLLHSDLADVLRPQEGGKVVNPHVVLPVRDLGPDFDAMRRALEPATTVHNEPKRKAEQS